MLWFGDSNYVWRSALSSNRNSPTPFTLRCLLLNKVSAADTDHFKWFQTAWHQVCLAWWKENLNLVHCFGTLLVDSYYENLMTILNGGMLFQDAMWDSLMPIDDVLTMAMHDLFGMMKVLWSKYLCNLIKWINVCRSGWKSIYSQGTST